MKISASTYLPQIGKCSICGFKAEIYPCSNENCSKLVCMDCSNDYIMPMLDLVSDSEKLPLLKCPSCGKDLIYDDSL